MQTHYCIASIQLAIGTTPPFIFSHHRGFLFLSIGIVADRTGEIVFLKLLRLGKVPLQDFPSSEGNQTTNVLLRLETRGLTKQIFVEVLHSRRSALEMEGECIDGNCESCC